MPKAYLGLGGNLGNVRENLEEAIRLLQAKEGLKVTKVSSYYETEPVGYLEQDWFVNIAAEIETQLSPYELLEHCSFVEQQLKRERLIRWGPRTIDIDILLYEGFERDEEKLTVPHPRMCERAFVIVPLMEIAPEMIIKGKSITEIAKNLGDQKIRKLEND
jgi:2-amino-4-hydroxy-6-hydroxymethyldihydropteridine diphosphokinase